MKVKVSGFQLLADEVRRALSELERQNYGMAKDILEAALQNVKEEYTVERKERPFCKKNAE